MLPKSPKKPKTAARSKSRSTSRGRAASKSPSRSGKKAQAAKTDSNEPGPSTQSTSARKSPSRAKPKSSPKQNPASPVTESTASTTSTTRSSRSATAAVEAVRSSSTSTSSTITGVSSRPTGTSACLVDAFSGLFIAFLMTAIPIYVSLACSKERCSIHELPRLPHDWRAYFGRSPFQAVLSLLAFTFVSFLVPIGHVALGPPVRGGHRLQYRINGGYTAMFAAVGLAAALYSGKVVNVVKLDMVQLLSARVIAALVLALIMAVQAARKRLATNALNPAATGNPVLDFVLGRELNPRFFGVDLKLLLVRYSALAIISHAVATLAESCRTYGGGAGPDPTVLLVSVMFLIYGFDMAVFEESHLHTMFVSSEGLGYVGASMVAFVPGVTLLPLRYVLDQPQGWRYWQLALFFLVFIVGYVIYRASNIQKAEFRKNPYNPNLAYLDSIGTSSGKRLIVSSWWGLCRHPNYLGDIVMAFAFSFPCGSYHFWPWFYPIFLVLLLVFRERQDYHLCHGKYGSAWDRYCERVPYRIFPKIY